MLSGRLTFTYTQSGQSGEHCCSRYDAMKGVLETETLSKARIVLAGIIKNVMWVLHGRNKRRAEQRCRRVSPGFLQRTEYGTRKYGFGVLVVS